MGIESAQIEEGSDLTGVGKERGSDVVQKKPASPGLTIRCASTSSIFRGGQNMLDSRSCTVSIESSRRLLYRGRRLSEQPSVEGGRHSDRLSNENPPVQNNSRSAKTLSNSFMPSTSIARIVLGHYHLPRY